jgi:membrane dipeptidase
MNSTTDLPVFDGHNDVLLSIYLPKNGQTTSFFNRNDHGHIDWPRMQEGGFAGGFFAVFVPSHSSSDQSIKPMPVK